ncbi:hypothetical protein C9374_013744 [Naegleria lovaniensis]|uniref:Metallo-beta-lactamase domain-containing protein n=1 Tax=Naegleria lovaniensis TaxID=51637 RepID=A0AA88GD13_NAELO|nr:uncharacterized protein C9374_013744 [Naegleria lovaniensis]KAG2370909.1 hypothetical protein C9374_013744 [Naegleria lovaniensis]
MSSSNTSTTQHVRAVGGATWIFQTTSSTSPHSLQIACDPVLCPKNHSQDYGLFKSTRLQDPVLSGDQDLEQVDVWLLTHGHEDHLDQLGLEKIVRGKNNSIIVAHPSVEKLLKNVLNQTNMETVFGNDRKVYWMEPQQDLIIEDLEHFSVKIHSVNAIHAKSKKVGAAIGNGNGYIVQVKEKNSDARLSKFYVTGDSVFTECNIQEDLQALTSDTFDFIITNGGEASVEKTKLIGGLAKFLVGNITNSSHEIIELHRKLMPKKTLIVHHGTFSHYVETYTADSFKEHSGIHVVFPGETKCQLVV